MSVPAFIGSARQSIRVTVQAIAGLALFLETLAQTQVNFTV